MKVAGDFSGKWSDKFPFFQMEACKDVQLSVNNLGAVREVL